MKIYNEIIMDMNPESESYKEVLSEDSFDHSGEIMHMGSSTTWHPNQGQWGIFGQGPNLGGPNRDDHVADMARQVKNWGGATEALSSVSPGTTDTDYTGLSQGKDLAGALGQLSNSSITSGLYSPVAGLGAGYAQGLPSKFNTALTDGPLDDLKRKTDPITNANSGGGALSTDYTNYGNVRNELPGLGGAVERGISGGLAGYEDTLKAGENALNTARGTELGALRDLSNFYGAAPSGYTQTPNITGSDEPWTYDANTAPTTKQADLEATLANSLSGPTTGITTAANAYADAMTGAGGLFGTGSQTGFDIGDEGGLSYDPGSAFDVDPSTGDITNIDPSSYGGDIFALLDQMKKSDEAFDLSEKGTRDVFGQDVIDADRDMRLAKEGKLDFSNKSRRDIEKLKNEQANSQLSAERLRAAAGGFYSGPTERTVSRDSGDLRSSLDELMNQYRVGSKGQEDAIRELRKGRERTQVTYEDDLSKNRADRKNLLSSDFAVGLEGLQGTANTNYDAVLEALGANAAGNLTSGFGDSSADDYQSVGDIAGSLGIADLFGGTAPDMTATGTAPNLTYGNMPDVGAGGSIGQQIRDLYTGSQGDFNDLRDTYNTDLGNLTGGIQEETRRAGSALETMRDPAVVQEAMENAAGTSRTNLNTKLGEAAGMIGAGGTRYGQDMTQAPISGIADPQDASTATSPAYAAMQQFGADGDALKNVLEALSFNIQGDPALAGQAGMEDLAVNLPAMPVLSSPNQGTIKAKEDSLGTDFQSLWEQVLSPEAKESFVMNEYELPAGALRTTAQSNVQPEIQEARESANQLGGDEEQFQGADESGTHRPEYAGILNQSTTSGGDPMQVWWQTGPAKDRGGVWQDYSDRIAQAHSKVNQSQNISLSEAGMLNAMQTPQTTSVAESAINRILGLDTYSPGVDPAGTNPLASSGTGKGLLKGGWKDSSAFNPYETAVNPENYLGAEAAPTANAQTSLLQYLVSQGLLTDSGV